MLPVPARVGFFGRRILGSPPVQARVGSPPSSTRGRFGGKHVPPSPSPSKALQAPRCVLQHVPQAARTLRRSSKWRLSLPGLPTERRATAPPEREDANEPDYSIEWALCWSGIRVIGWVGAEIGHDQLAQTIGIALSRRAQVDDFGDEDRRRRVGGWRAAQLRACLVYAACIAWIHSGSIANLSNRHGMNGPQRPDVLAHPRRPYGTASEVLHLCSKVTQDPTGSPCTCGRCDEETWPRICSKTLCSPSSTRTIVSGLRLI
jgi:hypothetical protein